jgi:hypothetical protein
MGAGVASLEDPGPACCRGGGGVHIRAACCRFATAIERASAALSKACFNPEGTLSGPGDDAAGDELQRAPLAPDAVGHSMHGCLALYIMHSEHKGAIITFLSDLARSAVHTVVYFMHAPHPHAAPPQWHVVFLQTTRTDISGRSKCTPESPNSQTARAKSLRE